MRLKSIEIQGFKSFKNKIKLSFGHPITGIVGPNGSGKSNISDAVRWVLGEQSAKQLRGHRMEDIIFAGTDKEKALNFCQVSMTFDNEDQWIPIAYKEVVITRRVFRSGESEYYINKSRARLKDLRELFMDTGIGKEGYSIIGQGRIDEILSSKPEERREIFEEASGIAKDKYRKEESLKKLDKTEENLFRIQDILTEQMKRMDFLEKEAKRAELGLKYSEKVREMELSLGKRNWRQKKNKSMALDEAYKKDQEEYLQLKEERQRLKKEIENLRHLYGIKNQKYGEVQKAYHDEQIEVEKLASKILLAKEREGHLIEEAQRMEKEIQEEEKEGKNQKSDLQKLEKKIQGEKITLKEKNKEKEKRSSNLSKLQRELQRRNEEFQENERIIRQLSSEITDLYIHKRTREELESSKKNMAEELDQKLHEIKKQLDEGKKNYQRKKEEYHQLREKLEFRKKTLEKEQSFLEEKREDLIEKDNHFRSLKSELTDKQNKYSFYLKIRNNYDGYYYNVQRFIKAVQKSPLRKNMIGTLAELITVKESFGKVIETLLSSSLQNIVVQGEEEAKVLIEFLKEKKIGRCTFLPLSKIKGRKRVAIEDDKILAIATDVLEFDEKYRGILESFLNQTVITKNMDDAIALSRKYPGAFRIATIDGDIINIGGSIVGGYSSKTKESGLLSQRENLNKAEADVKKTQEKVQKFGKSLEIEKGHFAEELEEWKEKTRVFQQEIAQLEPLKDDLEKEKLEIILIEEEKKSLIHRQKEEGIGLSFTKEDERNLREMEKKKEIGEFEQEKQSHEIQEFRENIQKEQLEFQRFLGILDRDERDLQLLENELADGKDRLQSGRERREKYKEERKKALEKGKELKREYEDFQRIRDEKNRDILKRKEELPVLEKETKRLSQQLEDLQGEEIKQQKDFNKMIYRMESLEKDKIRLIEEIANLEEDIKEKYNVSLAEVEESGESFDPKKLAEYRKKLSEIGYFSIETIEEYQSCKKDVDFLRDQKDDLLQSKEDLLEIIRELDREMTKSFVDSFRQISRHFEKIFKILFHGGEAKLILESDDVLHSGVEIVARPPGKKLRHLNLLSGGEKSLTAVALLFAIFETSPSPFCILDEIDASLDEANIYRYTDYLREFSDDTQFIMITHRKSTMEICDSLYGVTMEKQGVSSVIKLNMEEYDYEI
ncbi:MAG: chromosome segregation protein SMC [Tissierellia bacterium]|nr:chromosome segregation protein SMC [Tissierellia bacterium]